MSLVIVSGLTIGSMYALVAIGLVVQYRFSKVFNLAHGAQALVGAHIFTAFKSDLGAYGAAILGIAAAAGIGLLIEYIAVERMPRATDLTRMMITIAFLLIILGVIQYKYGTTIFSVPTLFTSSTVTMGGVVVTGDQVISVVILAVVTIGLMIFFAKAKVGILMRASGNRPVLARTLGVNSTALGRIIWALGGALAGVAGIFLIPTVNLQPTVYTLLVLQAYTAVLVGRLDSIPLTVVGGLALGIAQNWAAYEFNLLGIRELVSLGFALAALLVGAKSLESAQTREAVA